MELISRRHADVVVLAPSGRIDHENAEAFKAALAPHLATCAAGRDRIVLDLARVEYVSSAGLRILILAARQVKAQSGTLVIAGLRPLVKEVFEIGRFTLVFTIYPAASEALAWLAGTRPAAADSG